MSRVVLPVVATSHRCEQMGDGKSGAAHCEPGAKCFLGLIS